MKINRIDYNTAKSVGVKVNKEKKDVGPPLSVEDTIHISTPGKKNELLSVDNSSVSQNKQVSTDAPLNITLDIDGKTVQKKIMGEVSDKEIVLNMKHSNDIHGNMSSVATMIKPDEFWVDAGDAWQGYNFHSIISSGREETDFMNLRDCDLAIPGNHFYDDEGIKGGKMLMEKANFPYLSANTMGLAPYAIAEVEGVKLAFIGVRTPEKRYSMVDPCLVKDVILTDPIEAVKKSMAEVKAKGVQNIILLSHLGLKATPEHPHIISDMDIAEKIPGIDVIIGGHTHTPTKEAVVVNGTRIVQAGIDSHSDVKTDNIYLGDLSLILNRSTGKITSVEHHLIPVDREKALDEDVKVIRDRYLLEENAALLEKLGKALGDFTHDIKTPVDSTLGNMITDAMRKETGADVAILDSNIFSDRGKDGGVKILHRGDVTMKDLTQTSLWLGGSLDLRTETWRVTGGDLKKVLEDGISKLMSKKEGEGLYQVSGLKMTYNPSNSEGNRVTQIILGEKPLDLDKNYTLTTSYYIAHWNPLFCGRDEGSVTDGRKIRHIVADYIKEKDSVMPARDGRINVSS